MNYTTHDQWTSLVPTSLTYPNGRQVTSGYDALYRKNTVHETSGGASIAQWQFFGNRTAKQTLGNGITSSFMNNAGTNSAVQAGVPNPAWGDKTTDRLGYDGSGRLIAKRFLPSGSTTSRVGFTTAYDPASNKLFERALHAESRSALYAAYDSMNRLLQYQRGVLASDGASIATPITLPGTDIARIYNLDGLGNWKNTVYTPEGGSSTTGIRQHNKLNEITRFATTPVVYDHGNNASSGNPLIAQRGNGNITDDGTRTYVYDALNRLTTVTRKSDSAPIATYTYDALGRRIRKIVTNGGVTGTVANATYTYLYDGQQIVEELTTDNTTLRQFVWGQNIDELTQLKTYGSTGTQPLAAGTYYPLQDLLYRTAATTKSTGDIVEAYDYDAYGNTLMYSGPRTDGLWFTDDDVTTEQPACEFLFTGRQYDAETRIYWTGLRYYIPVLGRSISRSWDQPTSYLPLPSLGLPDSDISGNSLRSRGLSEIRQGETRCDSATGRMVQRIFDTGCSSECTQQHEDVHVKQSSSCCARHKACRDRFGFSFCIAIWNEWIDQNEDSFECEAYTKGRDCAKWKMAGGCGTCPFLGAIAAIFGQRLSADCCHDLEHHRKNSQSEIDTGYCTTAKARTPCPFDNTGNVR